MKEKEIKDNERKIDWSKVPIGTKTIYVNGQHKLAPEVKPKEEWYE